MTTQEAFGIAVQHHHSGRLAEAEVIYRQILAVEPGNGDALHYLGIIAHQVGRMDVAVELIRQAIALKPDNAEAFGNLGMAMRASGHLPESIAAYRQAIALKPNYPEAHSNLGNALKESGELDEAIRFYRQAIALDPNFPSAHSNLGAALRAKGQVDEAIASFRQAIHLKPDFADAHNNLGNAQSEKGQLDEAVASYRQAIALKPNFPEAFDNLGSALKDKGQLDEAVAAYRQAISQKTNFFEAIANLGDALRAKGQLVEAIATCRQAVAIKPAFHTAHCNLGIALNAAGQLDEAMASFRHAIELRPEYPEAYNNLGVALADKGQLDEAISVFRQAIALKPGFADAHSNLLLALNYHPDLDARFVAEEHFAWDRQHMESLQGIKVHHLNDADPERRLRVGYVSPDFRDHSVGQFLLPLLSRHDHQKFEIICYAQVPAPDGMTEQLRACADQWHTLTGLSDAKAAELIRVHQIDILVDLSGYTAFNRLLVFAHKPAPVQVTFLGYPNTTGLATMDHRLTDDYADPAGMTEHLHSEQLHRLSACAWCYHPLKGPQLTRRREGAFTFGCFNNFAKITNAMLAVWARILRLVPGSRLLLKARALASESTRQRVGQILTAEGIDAARFELRGQESDPGAHLALYSQMDIALDPFPYHGTMTTCEALWMGVPVVSLAGKTHASRVGLSLLSNVGLPELVASSEEQYVDVAVGLAKDLSRLAGLRSTLRSRMEQSPLMDGSCYAREIETAYREMWSRWCLGPRWLGISESNAG